MLKIRNEAARATVYLYGTIGPDMWDADGGNDAKGFAQTLDALSPKPLDIRIDSCGGDVYEGFAIASAIQRYEGETTAHVDGVAASAASYIALMADRVVMADYAHLMIHDAWTTACGDSREMLETAGRLDAVDASIASIIAARSGMALDEVRAAMDKETWYDAEAAVAAGLADEVDATGERVAASLDAALLGRFRRVPDAVAGAGSHATHTIPADGGRRLVVLGNRVYEEKE